MSEPIGVMKCWECVEKHARDLEHHYEDIIRVETDPQKRLKYEEAIDFIRQVRKEAHSKAKDIATDEDEALLEKYRAAGYWNGYFETLKKLKKKKTSQNPEPTIGDLERWLLRRGITLSKYEVMPWVRRESLYSEFAREWGEDPESEEIEFSEPIRRERGKEVYVDIYHEKEECYPKTFRTIKPNPEHILTVCCPQAPVAGRCPVSMIAQKLEHLHPEGEGSCPVCEAVA